MSELWQRPGTDAVERDPRAITEAHRRRLGGGRLLAATPRLDWGRLLERTYQFDVFTCPRCHGPTRVIAAITEPAVIRKILDHVREPPARAPPSRAREPGEDGIDAADVWLDPEVDVTREGRPEPRRTLLAFASPMAFASSNGAKAQLVHFMAAVLDA